MPSLSAQGMRFLLQRALSVQTLMALLVAVLGVTLGLLPSTCSAQGAATPQDHPPIPMKFTLAEPGYVTLVIEDANGQRVRNLVSETPFPAGVNTVWWDGLDDLERDPDAAAHAVYHIPGKFVTPGTYRVRGLVRKDVHLRYEFTVYNEGNPPWKTKDTGSEWLANHTPPCAVCSVPAGQAPARHGETTSPPQVLIGSWVTEGGSGLAWVDLDGHKLHGQMWIGGVWTGAQYLTTDAGTHGVPGVYAYAGATFDGELRLHTLVNTGGQHAPGDNHLGYGEDPAILNPTFKLPSKAQEGLSGICVYNGLMVASLSTMHQLLFIDVAAGKTLGSVPCTNPGAPAFDARGRLWLIQDNKVLRATVPTLDQLRANAAMALSLHDIISAGLEDPQQLAFDQQGNVYISDRGLSHQVKVFSEEGAFLRAIGHPGIPAAGLYDPLHMNNPKGLTITDEGHLWVTEEDFQPKRVSVWTLDGKLVKALYGPAVYGGGGVIDPVDKTLFYSYGMTFKLDWAKGTGQLQSIHYRPKPGDLPTAGCAPETALYHDGRKYLTNCYGSDPTGGTNIAFIWADRNGIAVPVAAVGRATAWPMLNYREGFSVRWSGQVVPKYSEPYTFFTDTGGAVRLWVNGQVIIDDFVEHGRSTDKSAPITLQAGKRYDIKMEYLQLSSGNAAAKLLWSSPSQPQEFISRDALYPVADATRAGGLTAEYYNNRDFTDMRESRVEWIACDFELGGRNGWPLPKTRVKALEAAIPQDTIVGKDPLSFVWSDTNGDGAAQAEEITFRKMDLGGITVMPDFTIVAALVGDTALRMPASRFSPQGAPVYDLATADTLVHGIQYPTSSGGGQALLGSEGWAVLTVAPKPFAPQSMGGARNGVPMWSYPSVWPGLHASHTAAMPEHPGEIIGTTRLLGGVITPRNSDAGEIWGINGNKGNMYLFTTDGLFVATLFKDCRSPEANVPLPQAYRELSFDGVTNGEESFYPSMTQTSDGNVYIVTNFPSIIRVDGLDTIRRLPATPITVTPDALAAAQQYFVQREAARQAQTPETMKVVLRTTPITLDGDVSEWALDNWTTIDQRNGQRSEVTLAVVGDRLYGAYKLNDPNALENSGAVRQNLFKTGGALDLMIGANPQADSRRGGAVAGDQRVLISRVQDKTVAMLFRPVAPGTTTPPVTYASPLRTIKFARVDEISAEVQLAMSKTGEYEFAIPLKTLGLSPQAGMTIRGDIGVLRGNGVTTVQRAYWHNKATGLTADLPSEADLTPQLWGQWQFVNDPYDGKMPLTLVAATIGYLGNEINFGGKRAIDGNPNTDFAGVDGAGFLDVDLGQSTAIRLVRLMPCKDLINTAVLAATNVNGPWMPIVPTLGATAPPQHKFTDYPITLPTSYRYLRVQYEGPDRIGITEFEVYR